MTMSVGERLPSLLITVASAVLGLAALLGPQIVAMLFPQAPAPGSMAWSLCGTTGCRPVDVSNLRLDAPTTTLRAAYRADNPPSTTPLAVHVVATASADVFWNGAPIGANGRVGVDRAHEIPGRFSAVVPVPQGHVRPGLNLVEVRLSAHHLWAPVVRPIHRLSVEPYADPLRRTLGHYLPILALSGLLAFAFIAAAGLWVVRRRRQAAILAFMSGAVLVQAAVEASKLALTYAYPWQLARLMTIAGLTALVAFLLGRLAIGRLSRRSSRIWLTVGLTLALVVALAAPPWWDAKALWCFRAGLTTVWFTAALWARKDVGQAYRIQAYGIQAGCILWLALSWLPGFLDHLYYAFYLLLFCGLGLHALGRPASSPAEAARSRQKVISIPNGASRHLIAADDLLSARAADDYSLITLADGRELLATVNLSSLIDLAPSCLQRIHRSHAVNPARVTAVHRSDRTMEMQGGGRIPIGRTYWAKFGSI